MSFTQATITHTFLNPDGTPASGQIVFTLTKRMTNGTQSIVPGVTVTAALNASGQLSQTLYANDDTGTIPADSQWRAQIYVNNADDGPYFLTVPTGGGTVDLGTLLPANPSGA